MNTNRKIAIGVGVLYIIGTSAGMLSVAFTGSIFDGPDYLARIAANQNQVIAGALCVLMMGLALALIPALMFPVLKKQHEVLALGYVIFRGALETVTYLITVISFLLLVGLSQGYVQAGASAAPYFQTIGAVLRGVSDLPMTVIVFSLGALMLYSVLYRSKLIPRWISIWGLIAIALHLSTSLLILFGLTYSFSTLVLVMNLAILVQEMVMAVWLIAKGFNPSAVASVSAKTATTELLSAS